MKWVTFAAVIVLACAVLWYFGVLQELGGAFDDWLKYIGAK